MHDGYRAVSFDNRQHFRYATGIVQPEVLSGIVQGPTTTHRTVFFADMGDALVGGGIVAIGSVAVAVIGAWAAFKDRASTRKLTEGNAEEQRLTRLCDRYEQQIQRLQLTVDQQQITINNHFQLQTECREQVLKLYGSLRFLHSTATRLRAGLIQLGAVDIEPIDELPPLEDDRHEHAEFLTRTAAENAALTGAITEQLKEDAHRANPNR